MAYKFSNDKFAQIWGISFPNDKFYNFSIMTQSKDLKIW